MKSSINLMLRENSLEELKDHLLSLTGFEIADQIFRKKFKDQLAVFTLLPPKLAFETFLYIPSHIQMKLLKKLPPSQTAALLAEIPPDDRTALLEELPIATLEEYIKLLPVEERSTAIALLKYPKDTVGRLMTPDYIAVSPQWTVEEVLNTIRAYGHESETTEMIYVVDDQGRLIDDIKLNEFLFAPKNSQVDQISNHQFIALRVDEKNEKAIRIFKEYGRSALPIIDDQGKMLGIVTIDDILRLASEKNTEKFQKVGGSEALDEPYTQTPFGQLIKKRARWLVLLFIGEMFTATAMGFWESEIQKAVVLALFLPLIISSGGNSGSQSTTLIIRAMALGEIRLKDWWKIMRREILAGLCLGSILGLIGFFRVTLWSSFSSVYGAHWLLIALTLFFSLLGVVMWGSLMGAMLPFFLRSLRIDPANASAPLVATLVDVTGIMIYFTVAMLILRGTLL